VKEVEDNISDIEDDMVSPISLCFFEELIKTALFISYEVTNCDLPTIELLHSVWRRATQGRNEVRWRPGQGSKFSASMFAPDIFRKLMHCIEETTCDIVGTFRRPGNCVFLPPRYGPGATIQFCAFRSRRPHSGLLLVSVSKDAAFETLVSYGHVF